MHSVFSTALTVSVLATAALASPQYGDSSATTTASSAAASMSGVHPVQVGPGLTFSPESLTANEGDWIEFTFGSGHSVAQSSFDAPCVPLASGQGVYSGFPDDGQVWRFQVNSTDPIWLYCSKVGHCEGGMSLVVNPPDSENTLEAYKAASVNANTTSPPAAQGGVFGSASENSSSSSSSGSGSSTTSATGSGASSSTTGSATGSAASAGSTGNAAADLASNSLFAAGAVAAAVAALL